MGLKCGFRSKSRKAPANCTRRIHENVSRGILHAKSQTQSPRQIRENREIGRPRFGLGRGTHLLRGRGHSIIGHLVAVLMALGTRKKEK